MICGCESSQRRPGNRRAHGLIPSSPEAYFPRMANAPKIQPAYMVILPHGSTPFVMARSGPFDTNGCRALTAVKQSEGTDNRPFMNEGGGKYGISQPAAGAVGRWSTL